MTDRLFLEELATPIGRALVVTDERGHVRALDWDDHADRMRRLLHRRLGPARLDRRARPISDARRALESYFDGDLGAIDDVAVDPGGTTFQRNVWEALRRIPAGRTMSYGGLAARLNHPTATRAVGRANGSNPVGIIIPCHRVIAADAALTGYAGGIARKRWLLSHESVSTPR